jgi:hypothetical protein
MNNLTDDIVYKILDKIEIKTIIKYLPIGDEEQNRTIFYEDDKKYRCCKLFNEYYINKSKKKFIDFFENF